MNLNFLDEYWKHKAVQSDKHFVKLDDFLMTEINSPGIKNDVLSTFYLEKKSWDMHFPEKKVAIEYKTIATEKHGSKQKHINLRKVMNHRATEAIGCAVDLKKNDPEYKLGYILVFTLPREANVITPKKLINRTISMYKKMVETNIYEFFCPMITYGINDHEELSKEEYNLKNFIKGIRELPTIERSVFASFFG